MVFIDAASRRPRRINDQERAAWAPYVEAPVVFTRRGGRRQP
jgi:acyl-CoA thioester hydrolase